MPKRYLKRIKPTSEETLQDKLDRNVDPDVALFEVLQEQERKITFGKKPPKPTSEKSIKEGTRYALDAAGNTGLYIRLINMRIGKQIEHIDQIKKLKKKFDDEIESLQSEIMEQKDQLKRVEEKIDKKNKKNK